MQSVSATRTLRPLRNRFSATLAGRGDGAELLEQTKKIKLAPAFRDLPVGNAENFYAGERNMFAGRRDALKVARSVHDLYMPRSYPFQIGSTPTLAPSLRITITYPSTYPAPFVR